MPPAGTHGPANAVGGSTQPRSQNQTAAFSEGRYLRNLRRGSSLEATPKKDDSSFIRAAARSAAQASGKATNSTLKSPAKGASPQVNLPTSRAAANAVAGTSPRRSRSSSVQTPSDHSSPVGSARPSIASSRRSSFQSIPSTNALNAATFALNQLPVQDSRRSSVSEPVSSPVKAKFSPMRDQESLAAERRSTQPAKIDPVRAAARASSKKSIDIAPRGSLSSKFVSSLAAALKREEEANRASAVPEPKGLGGINQSLFYERVMDRLSEDRKSGMSLSPSQSSNSVDHPEVALRAAMGARARAESHVAHIQDEVQSRNRRKQAYKPLAEWSSQRFQFRPPPAQQHPAADNASILSLRSQESQSDFSKAYSAALAIPAAPAKGFISWLSKQSPGGSERPVPANPFQTQPVPEKESHPSSAQPKQRPMRQTLRKTQKGKFNEDKPWKHHQQQITGLTEKERKRYDRVWAANCGSHLPYIAIPQDERSLWLEALAPFEKSGSPQSSFETRETTPDALSISESVRAVVDARSKDIHGIVVGQLWRRSSLPDETLSTIWDLVDTNKDGTLARESFIAGMWLVDQCLYGRKLPWKLQDEVWQSIVGLSDVKIRLNHGSRPIPRLKLISTTKKAGKGSVKIMKKAMRKAATNNKS